MARPACFRAVMPALSATLPALLLAAACRSGTGESDASACARLDAKGADSLERPGAGAGKSAVLAQDVPGPGEQWHPQALPRRWGAPQVSAGPCTPDAVQFAAQSFVAAALAAAHLARLVWLPLSEPGPPVRQAAAVSTLKARMLYGRPPLQVAEPAASGRPEPMARREPPTAREPAAPEP
jgi:hypothetical protein